MPIDPSSPSPMLNRDKMKRSIMTAAQGMIGGECREGNLQLVDKDEKISDLIEWKLYYATSTTTCAFLRLLYP